MLLLIDFEKAFDSVSWKFMHKTLQFFNFGNDMKTWIKLLYNGAQLCVIHNGIFFFLNSSILVAAAVRGTPSLLIFSISVLKLWV